MSQRYELAITATGEVRDAEGNLISSTPVESKITVSESELHDLGLEPPEGDKT